MTYLLTVGYKIGGNEYQRLGYDPGYRRVLWLPRDLRSSSAISRNRWYVEIWPIPKLSVSSIMTEFLALLSQKKFFKTGIKFWPDKGSNSQSSRIAQFCNRLSFGLYSSDYYYSPNSSNAIKIRRVVHQKHLSGSQIRISIRITPNFELGVPMVITSLLTIFHQNPTNSLSETVIRISDPDFNPDHAQLWTRCSYGHYLPTHQISSKSDQ